MTSADVAELLGHPVKLIQIMCRAGRFPAHREPGAQAWQFDRDELLAWMRSATQVTPAAE
ncbi:MAG: helix-turn-helix domain-containing protein [Acidimicrobiia bacterium]|nr:helix-turn-helix domain-containing protein [Acidimicrobiia bacterium]MDH3398677.1 helix-turn-helix domain-containing protein [Acidimicrobiia bacterium]